MLDDEAARVYSSRDIVVMTIRNDLLPMPMPMPMPTSVSRQDLRLQGRLRVCAG